MNTARTRYISSAKLVVALVVVTGSLGPTVPVLAKQAGPSIPTTLDTTSRERQVARLVTRFVERAHYSRLTVDDTLSDATLKTYLETLDGNRHYFLQSDIAYFARYKTALDDALRTGDMEPVFDIFRLYRLRAQQNISYAMSLLDKEPDFTVNEDYVFDREKLAADIEYRHRDAIDIDHPAGARDDLADRRHLDPVRHDQTATTSMSGSICRTRFSMPAKVPDSELGQLPQAPW
mgnify:CR=1 FL=1